MSLFAKVLIITVVFFTYFLYGWVCISDSIKASKYFYVIGLSFPLIGNFLWLFFARGLDPKETLLFGGIWDLAVAISYPLAALIFSNVALTPGMYAGTFLFVCGAICFKF